MELLQREYIKLNINMAMKNFRSSDFAEPFSLEDVLSTLILTHQ